MTRELEVEHRSFGVHRVDTRERGEPVGFVGSPEADGHVAHSSGPQDVDRLGGDESSVADDRHVVAEVLHLVEHVRGEEDRGSGPRDFATEVPELVLHERVDTRSRLVEDEQLGSVHERLDQGDLLTVAA